MITGLVDDGSELERLEYSLPAGKDLRLYGVWNIHEKNPAFLQTPVRPSLHRQAVYLTTVFITFPALLLNERDTVIFKLGKRSGTHKNGFSALEFGAAPGESSYPRCAAKSGYSRHKMAGNEPHAFCVQNSPSHFASTVN